MVFLEFSSRKEWLSFLFVTYIWAVFENLWRVWKQMNMWNNSIISYEAEVYLGLLRFLFGGLCFFQ